MSADGDLKTIHRALVEMYAGRADKALAGSALAAVQDGMAYDDVPALDCVLFLGGAPRRGRREGG